MPSVLVTDRLAHDRRYGVRASRIRALGWRPTVRFEDGLDRTVDWYRDNPGWWRPLRERASGYFRVQYAQRLRAARPGRTRARR